MIRREIACRGLPRSSPSDPINIQFTSGTGQSERRHADSQKYPPITAECVGDGMHLTEPRPAVRIPVPLYHCFGMVMANLACITHGSAARYSPGEAF